MSCPHAIESALASERTLTLRAHPRRIGLVGNPNVGKSVIFGRLTGRYATVSNFPGTTVGIMRGRAVVGNEVCDVIDTPGVNTLEGALSEDERITAEMLRRGDVDVVVQVADARNLRRALVITAQLAAIGRPMLLVLNMIDEARTHGVDVNAARLGAELGIPVIEAVAVEGRGLPEIRAAFDQAAVPRVLRAGGEDVTAWAHETAERHRRVSRLSLARTQEWLGRVVRHPVSGLPVLAVVLYGMYLFVGVFGAQTLVGLVENDLFGAYINPAVTWLVGFVPVAIVRDFFVGEYGLITMGLTYAIAIVLPVVATFFLVFGFLEDSGYLPRLAIFSDRLFRAMGLNGKAVLPMVLGLGCDTMATMTTRILATPKERLIAIVLLALGVPCSAQLATILGILGGIAFGALATLTIVVLSQMLLVGFLAARVLPGDRSDFILELPPLRWPRAGNVLRKSWLRVWWYLGEAVPLFLIGTALLFVMDRIGALALLTGLLEPLVSGWLGLPSTVSGIFVMGFLRRDYGAAGLFALAQDGALTPVQAVVALTVMTLFVPCVANFLMIVRERGLRVGVAILVVISVLSVTTGGLLNHLLRALNVTF